MRRLRLLGLLLLFWLSSCNVMPEATITEINEGTSSRQDSPAVLSEPTPVPQVTATFEPTGTPAPKMDVPLSISGVLDDVVVTSADPFDEVLDNWYQGMGYLDIRDGVGIVSVTSEGFGYLYPGSVEGDCREYGEGDGIYFKFKLPSDNLYRTIISFQSGTEDSDDYIERGISFEFNNLNRSYISYLVGWSGSGDGRSNLMPNQRMEGNLSILPEQWYDVMMVINQKGELLIKIWDPEAPQYRLIKQVVMGNDWEGRRYNYSLFTMGTGDTMMLDDFSEFTFQPGDILLSAIDYELPAPVVTSLTGARVLTHVDFEKHPNWFAQSGFFSVKNGVGKLEINPASKTSSAYLVPGPPMKPLQVQEGRAVFLKYMVNQLVDAGFSVSSGEWETPDYREFGLMTGFNEVKGMQTIETNCWTGAELLPSCDIGDDSIFIPEADRWYQLLLAMDANGKFMISVWDVEHPENVRSKIAVMDEDWLGRTWQFNVSFLSEIPTTSVYIDDYIELSFNTIVLEEQ